MAVPILRNGHPSASLTVAMPSVRYRDLTAEILEAAAKKLSEARVNV